MKALFSCHFLKKKVILMSKKIDMLGEKIGKLTVVSEAGRSPRGDVLWNCQCNCGGKSVVRGFALRNKNNTSCSRCPPSIQYSFVGNIAFGTVFGNKIFIIDKVDYELIKRYQWHSASSGYIAAIFKGKATLLHRLITEAQKGQSVDHINGNTLDNRRNNLRLCTHQQNMCNMKKPKTNTSGYKGVYWHKGANCYISSVKENYKNHYLGCFKNKVDAAQTYDSAAIKYHGEFAKINFPEVITS